MNFIAEIIILPIPELKDPQSSTVFERLKATEKNWLLDLKMGKYIRLQLEAEHTEEATSRIEELCRQVLANPVTETFRFEIHPEETD